MRQAQFLKIVLGVLCISSLATAVTGVCSKDLVQQKTNEICKAVTEKGADAKKDWPTDLLYQNCGDNYVWVQDTSPEIKMVLHPVKRRMEGMALNTYEDENKFKLFVEFDKAAKANSNGGWVDYVWTKPGAAKTTPKTSFVRLCKGKDGTAWVVGSGVWKEDIDKK